MDLNKSFNSYKFIVVYGPSDYLINKTLEKLAHNWKQDQSTSAITADASELKDDDFRNLWEVSSIFEPKNFALIRRVEKKLSFANFLKSIPSANSINNTICLAINSNTIAAKLSKEIKRLDAKIIPCFEPTPYEMKSFIKGLAKRYKLNLSMDSIDLFNNTIGDNLFDIDNELEKLSLIFHDSADKTIQKEELSKYLPVLKSEHIFKLDNYIIEQNKAHTMSLLYDLSSRENPLGILAMISGHCRKAIKIAELHKNRLPIAEISSKAKVPPFVVKKYLPYVKKKKSSNFTNTLLECQKADKLLKTTKISPDVILGSVILSLFK